MNALTVLVTGASGFVGRTLVRNLSEKGYRVKAGVHDNDDLSMFDDQAGVESHTLDILDRKSLLRAMSEVDHAYHFAALVDSRSSREELLRVNVEGTRNVWECAAASGVKKILYCSSAAVYGLLARSVGAMTEHVPAKALEPYGNTKLLGEKAALEISARTGLHTIVIRPVAIFGPGEHTPFGRKLRDAAVSKLLIAGGFQNKKFNFIHVDDVAEAAIFLMDRDIPSGEIFNIAVNEPISYEEAFQAYIRVLRRAGSTHANTRLLALISSVLHKRPSVVRWVSGVLGERCVFKIWRPGFDLNYSSGKLLETSFRPRWTDFEEVFFSCVEKDEGVSSDAKQRV